MEYSSPTPSSPALSAMMASDPVALLADFDLTTTVTPSDLASPSPFPDIKLEGDDLEDGEADKKPTKKRKSWGQVLPEPKTNLPPRLVVTSPTATWSTSSNGPHRKRAKTEDEKEQRRVERVIRNRKAASASRERKRQEAEALALRNKELEAQLSLLQERNQQLERELKIVRPEYGASSPTNESVTFSQELFPPQAMSNMSQSSLDFLDDLLNTHHQAPKTVDPMTISPALSPVPEDPEFEEATVHEEPAPQQKQRRPQQPEASKQQPAQAVQATTSHHPSTQYPAAVLWHDLQCQRPVEAASWLSAALHNHLTSVLMMLQIASSLSTTFLTLWATKALANSSTRTTSRSTSSPRLPRSTALISIILTVTNPLTRASSSTSISAPTSQATAQPTTPSSSNKKTLRLRTLRKLLTCNRQLARPLQDATLEVLRLGFTKESGATQVILGLEQLVGASVAPDLARQVADAHWPSKERLMTLLWAIRSLERRIELREQGVQDVKNRSSKMAPRVTTRMRRSRDRPRDTT